MSWHQLPPSPWGHSHSSPGVWLDSRERERKSEFGIWRDRARGELGKIGRAVFSWPRYSWFSSCVQRKIGWFFKRTRWLLSHKGKKIPTRLNFSKEWILLLLLFSRVPLGDEREKGENRVCVRLFRKLNCLLWRRRRRSLLLLLSLLLLSPFGERRKGAFFIS